MNKFQSFPSFVIKKLVFVVSSFAADKGTQTNRSFLSFFLSSVRLPRVQTCGKCIAAY